MWKITFSTYFVKKVSETSHNLVASSLRKQPSVFAPGPSEARESFTCTEQVSLLRMHTVGWSSNPLHWMGTSAKPKEHLHCRKLANSRWKLKSWIDQLILQAFTMKQVMCDLSTKTNIFHALCHFYFFFFFANQYKAC